jgi:hypothetical protein
MRKECRWDAKILEFGVNKKIPPTLQTMEAKLNENCIIAGEGI